MSAYSKYSYTSNILSEESPVYDEKRGIFIVQIVIEELINPEKMAESKQDFQNRIDALSKYNPADELKYNSDRLSEIASADRGVLSAFSVDVL